MTRYHPRTSESTVTASPGLSMPTVRADRVRAPRTLTQVWAYRRMPDALGAEMGAMPWAGAAAARAGSAPRTAAWSLELTGLAALGEPGAAGGRAVAEDAWAGIESEPGEGTAVVRSDPARP